VKPQGQSQSVSVDPATQQYVDYMRRVAMGYVTPGGIPPGGGQVGSDGGGGGGGFFNRLTQGGLVNAIFGGGGGGSNKGSTLGSPIAPNLPPEIAQAQQQFADYAKGGNLGFSALTGNADAASQFMNPYLSQMNPFFAQQRAQAVQGANDLSTQMGAFGGDRSQIAALLAGQQADQSQAGFNYDAFNQAMQRALSAANLGYGAAAQGAFLPQQYASGQLGLLGQAMGPYGQTQSQPTHNDPWSQLGGILAIAKAVA